MGKGHVLCLFYAARHHGSGRQLLVVGGGVKAREVKASEGKSPCLNLAGSMQQVCGGMDPPTMHGSCEGDFAWTLLPPSMDIGEHATARVT
jgi:hypothetical protein